jgi:hypothetical protein
MELSPSHLQALADRFGTRSFSVPYTIIGQPTVEFTVPPPPSDATYVFTVAQLAALAKEVVAVDRRPNPAHGAPMPPGYRPYA